MKTFNEWLNEGMPVPAQPTGFHPGTRDPLTSALVKIEKNPGQMPFDGGFTGPSVFAVRFQMSPEELAILQKLRLLVRDEYGTHIDRNRFAQVYQQILKTPPSIK